MMLNNRLPVKSAWQPAPRKAFPKMPNRQMGQLDIHKDPENIILPGLIVTAAGAGLGFLGYMTQKNFITTMGAVTAGVGIAITLGRLLSKNWISDSL